MEETGEPVEYECLHGYQEVIATLGERLEFRTAVCEPKSRDNRLESKTILQSACPRCPVYLRNQRMIKSGRGKASDLAIDVKDRFALPGSRKFRCGAQSCYYETNELEEARAHQELAGSDHYFPV